MDPQQSPLNPSPTQVNDKLLAILCHLSLFLSFFIGFGFVVPLVIYLVKKDESALVAAHAKEALNFQLSLLLYAFGFVCAIPLAFCLIGIPIILAAVALSLMSIICAIIAAIQASEGAFYFYPLTIRFIT
ncbi:MAG: DUF4870 domain-containing protein [Methylacidiphilales bacterium]|nr:DUF4870 domain-containing protein [Candidatus Methylacidiphilales bacterium]